MNRTDLFNGNGSAPEAGMLWEEEIGRSRLRSIRRPRPRRFPARPGRPVRRPGPRPRRRPWAIRFRGSAIPGDQPGSHGSEYVRWVQTMLNQVLNLQLPVNGVLDVQTRSAVRSFQEKNGLPVTGIVGPDTERALLGAGGGSSSPATRSLRMTAPTRLDSPSPAQEFELLGPPQLRDIVINPPSRPGSYGTASSSKNPTMTTTRCKDGVARPCPELPGLEAVAQVNGVGFEYIAGWTDKNKKKRPGIVHSRSSGRWIVVDTNRLKNRVHKMLPRAGDSLATFLANMKAINLPVEAILTMGSLYCRCISNTTKLSNHSYGDAIDIGGVRLVGGQEVLVANSGHAADRKLLHRVNACLRLSFATVLDYHDKKRHWNHFHCDTNIQNGGARRWDVAWPFIRESLGLSPVGGWNKTTANALRQFAGPDAVKDRPTLARTLSKLFMREAMRS